MDTRLPRPGVVGSAVFVDVENMAFANTGTPFQIDRLMAQVLRESAPVVRRAYGDWRALGLYADAFHETAFDQVQVTPANGQKNAADIHLSIDAIETVLTNPHVQRVYLVSGDSDYCPLVRSLRRHGREVVCVAWSNSLAEMLRHHCDRVIHYEHVAGLAVRPAAVEAPRPAPAPPRRPPVRRPAAEVDEFAPVLDRFAAEAETAGPMPEQEARARLMRLDPGIALPTGAAFRDWLQQHPRIRVDADGDEASVSVVPAGPDVDDEAIDELNAVLATENLVFLGADIQEAVVDTLHEVLAQRVEPVTRAEALQMLRFRLRDVLPDVDLDYDNLNSVFHIFYRAHAFQRFAAAGVRNAPLLLKAPFRDRDALHHLHDRYVIHLAVRQGIRWSAERWAEVLFGAADRTDEVEPILLAAVEPAGPVGEGAGGET